MAFPIVTIVGRPNVGKSSLLNALAGEWISIVEPTAGVTRDRISTIVEHNSRFFELIDTGGYGIVDSDQLSEHVENQIRQAIEQANLVLFVVDIREGVMPLDVQIAQLLRKQDMEVLLVANKADTAKMFPQAGEFVRLGFGEAFCVSAANNLNQALLMEKILERLEHLPQEAPQTDTIKIAVVGKRNAGKSTFINTVVGQPRLITSEIPGTTRDAVDVRFEFKAKHLVLIDTAGVRKKSSIADSIEFYSYTRATRSIRRADVVLFLIDATLEISQVDKKLAHLINEHHKACILLVNKWDLVENQADAEDYREYLDDLMPQFRHAPIVMMTAKTGQNVHRVLDLAIDVYEQASQEIPTPLLNKAVEAIQNERISVARKKGGKPKIYYATQVAVRPISLLLFVNQPDLFDNSFKRFAINRFRELLGLEEVPIRLLLRSRH
ncbi:MAG: ribosome biogenesis GTPase Der [Sedimentisphaerales bacterium]|nr:ribosome biogenesis GTPase Der [Sedimentisphaerales bacterium]